jgi:sec-independent protein translocase protein TatA
LILFLNDIAGSEILLILVFILMFFGSKSIPGLARTMGRTIRQVKEATSEIQNEIKKSGEGMKKDLNLDGLIRETSEDIRRPLDQMANDLDNAVKYVPKKTNSHLNESRIVETPEVKPTTIETESNTNDSSMPEIESNEQK